MSLSLRIIVDYDRPAPFNMAADLHLMQQCVGSEVVTVRFYTWKPAAITLGRLQRADQQLLTGKLRDDGLTWIRRPTGGRAVLHQDDLTYSCIFSHDIAQLGTQVAETYGIITRCLSEGLADCGIAVTSHEQASPLIKSARTVKLPCFLAPNRNEIMVKGRKLIGSAQYRSSEAVLQHGSLPLGTAYRRLPYYMPLSADEQRAQEDLLARKSIALGEIDSSLSPTRLITAFEKGFVKVLGCPGVRADWTDVESEAIRRFADSPEFRQRWMTVGPDDAVIV